MKRFNAQKEIKKLERRNSALLDGKKRPNFLVPIFVLCASCVCLIGASFSANLEGKKTTDNTDLSYREEKAIIEGATINDDLGVSVYFTNAQGKYVLFNDMLFRLVRINGDGTIRLMATESINRVYLNGSENNNFNYDFNLDIGTNLNNWFNYKFSGNKYVINGVFDNDIYDIDKPVYDLVNTNSYYNNYVGLLSYREYKLIFKFDNQNTFYLNNYNFNNQRYCVYNGVLGTCDDNIQYEVLPVINIKADKFSGTGDIDSPYQLIENTNIEE